GGRGPRGGNDDHVDEFNGQRNDQGVGANRGIKGVNGNGEGVNGGVGGALDFSTIIAQQLQNLLPAILAQRWGGGRGPRGGNDDHVDEFNGQRNDQGVGANRGIKGVNGNREGVNGGVGGALDFSTIIAQQLQNLLPAILAQGGVVVLTRWIEKMKSVQDMSDCSINQKVKYTSSSFVEFCPGHEMQKLETKLWNYAMVRAGHAAYTDRFHELA
nr:hypothetical protein [Tanacetum cinerariifolium]